MKETENIIAAFTDNHMCKYKLFEKTLIESGFFESIDAALCASGKKKDEFKVVIKPNITMLIRRDDDGIYTDPTLVIHLLRLLVKKGYSNLTVVESQNFYGEWFTNRSVIQIAARARYFEEDVLHSYQGEHKKDIYVKGDGVEAHVPLVDLTLDMEKYDFSGTVGEIDLGKTWMHADFRINFAKMKTHFYCYYTLAIKNIYGCLPLQDKIREYHCKNVLPQWTAKLIKEFPVNFSIIDGYTAADGMQGAKMKALSFKSHTFIAGEDILGVDHFTASLMKQSPEKSVLYTELTKLIPERPYKIIGNAKPFEGWKNPGWLYVTLTDKAQGSAKMMEVLGSILTGGYDECFPMKKDERSLVRKVVTYPKHLGNFFTDIESVKIKMKKMFIKWSVIRHKKKVPCIAGSGYILSRLPYLNLDDAKRMISLFENAIDEKVRMSGHYFLIGNKEVAFPARLHTTNIAVLEIINYAINTKIQKELINELKRLFELDTHLFRKNMTYPFCYE